MAQGDTGKLQYITVGRAARRAMAVGGALRKASCTPSNLCGAAVGGWAAA